jgi:hypothetical protein
MLKSIDDIDDIDGRILGELTYTIKMSLEAVRGINR